MAVRLAMDDPPPPSPLVHRMPNTCPLRLTPDRVLYVRVVDPVKASYGVDNALYAVGQLAQTTMRSELGKITLVGSCPPAAPHTPAPHAAAPLPARHAPQPRPHACHARMPAAKSCCQVLPARVPSASAAHDDSLAVNASSQPADLVATAAALRCAALPCPQDKTFEERETLNAAIVLVGAAAVAASAAAVAAAAPRLLTPPPLPSQARPLLPPSPAPQAINEAADAWGLQCMRYEIKDITPPSGIIQVCVWGGGGGCCRPPAMRLASSWRAWARCLSSW